MKSVGDEMREHPFFSELAPDYVQRMAACGEHVLLRAGTVIAAEGGAANECYVLHGGRVLLQLHASPSGTLPIQTLDAGDILGWSWLFPPYHWSFEAVAVQDVRAIRLDGACLRGKCDADPAMGYALMKAFSRLMVQRVEAARLQLLDLYAGGDAA